MKTFDALFAELSERARTRPAGSGTVAALDGGVHGLGKKILEEAGEVWLAAEHESDEALAEEISQLLYWTQVLMISRGPRPSDDVYAEPVHGDAASARRRTQQGRAQRIRRRDPVRGRLPAPHRSQGPDGRRPRQQRRILLSAAQGHRDLRRAPEQLDLGITGRDLAAESDAPGARKRLALGFGSSTFRYAALRGRIVTVSDDLAGKRIATALPESGAQEIWRTTGSRPRVIRLDGAVEISIQLGVADAIADYRGLRAHPADCTIWWLSVSRCVIPRRSLIERADSRTPDAAARDQLAARVQGVVFGQQYLMLDYDCPRSVLDEGQRRHPGLESPTIAPLADPAWVAVRALVPRRDVNAIMDETRRHRGEGHSGVRHPILPVLTPRRIPG